MFADSESADESDALLSDFAADECSLLRFDAPAAPSLVDTASLVALREQSRRLMQIAERVWRQQ